MTFDTRHELQAQPELFVVYAERDSEWVHGFLLPEVGLDPRSVLTPQDFRPGAAVVQELERAVETARLTVLVLSPAFGMSQWSVFAELLASHDSLRRNSDRLVPVLLEPYELPLHLDFRVRLDCTVRSRWETETARLRELLQRGAPPAERLPCPYPGLVAFGPEDAGLFFGRDRESDDISRRVRQQNFLLVVGPSGSGKSSLVLAGVAAPVAGHGRRPLAGADAAPRFTCSAVTERDARRGGDVRGREPSPPAGGRFSAYGAPGRAAAALLRPSRGDLPATAGGADSVPGAA